MEVVDNCQSLRASLY